jgi:hypothetical protein
VIGKSTVLWRTARNDPAKWTKIAAFQARNCAPSHPRRQRGTQAMSNGAQGRNRTTDTAIFSRMLYQLSYLGIRLPLQRAGV